MFLRKVGSKPAEEVSVVTALAEILRENEVFGQVEDEKLGGVHHDEVLGLGMRDTVVFHQLPSGHTHQLDGHASGIAVAIALNQCAATRVADPCLIFAGSSKDALLIPRI